MRMTRKTALAPALCALALVAAAAAACEAEYGVDQQALLNDDNPLDPTLTAGGARNPFAPQAGGSAFGPGAGPVDGVEPEGLAQNPYDPVHYGRGDEDEAAGVLLGGALTFYYCSCLEPGGFLPTIGFYACASNPFEAANFSVNKPVCIFAGGCQACVCYPGLPCVSKG
jgi:hypothetical protein